MSTIARQSALEFELIWERVAITNRRRGEQMRDAISFRQVTRLEIVFTQQAKGRYSSATVRSVQ